MISIPHRSVEQVLGKFGDSTEMPEINLGCSTLDVVKQAVHLLDALHRIRPCLQHCEITLYPRYIGLHLVEIIPSQFLP